MTRAAIGLFLLLAAAPGVRGEDVPDPFVPADARAKTVFTREPTGALRVVTPPAALTRALRLPYLWHAPCAAALGGDFEVSASFDVTALGPAGPPVAEANVELAVVTRGGDYRPYGINVNAIPGDGRCFRVIRFAPNRAGTHWNTLAFPRKFDQGRLCLRRRGSELVFLAADGPGAPLVELVRYPADPRANPTPRLTAFQGQKANDPMPVNVTLSDVKVQAERVLRDPAAANEPPRPTVPATYPVTVWYGVNGAKLFADFPRANDEGRAFRTGPSGVHIKPPTPPAGATDPNTYWSRDSRFVVSGDFEISWQCDPRKLVPPPGPGGNGTCHVGFGLETGTPIGSVSVARGEVRGQGPRFVVTRQATTKQGDTFDTQTVPAKATSQCRMWVRRTGPELTMLTQEDGDPAPRELVRFPFPPDVSPRVRLAAYQGGPPPAPMDATLADFRVSAGKVYDPDAPATAATTPDPAAGEVVLDGLPPAPRSRKWAYLAWAGGVVCAALVVVAGAVVWRRRKARATSLPSAPRGGGG